MSKTDVHFFRNVLVVAGLWLVLMISGLAVVYTTHVSRQLMNELQVAKREVASLHATRSQYLLERSTWAAYNRVEDLAGGQLNMQIPAQDKVVVITE